MPDKVGGRRHGFTHHAWARAPRPAELPQARSTHRPSSNAALPQLPAFLASLALLSGGMDAAQLLDAGRAQVRARGGRPGGAGRAHPQEMGGWPAARVRVRVLTG